MAVLLVLVVALPCVVGALCLALGMKLVNWRPEWPAFSRGRREEVPIAGVTCTVSLAAAASAKAAVSMEEGIPEGALKPSPDRTPFILAPPLDPSPPASPRAVQQLPLSPVLRYKPAPEPGQQSCELTLEEDLPSFLSSPQQVGAAVLSSAASARRLLSPASSAPVEIVLPAEVCHSDIKIIEKLGEGAQGSVYRALWKGAAVAVKCMKVKFGDADSRNRVAREVFFSKLLHFPQVIQCLGWTWVNDSSGGNVPNTPCGAALRRQHSWGLPAVPSSTARRSLLDTIGVGVEEAKGEPLATLRHVTEAAEEEETAAKPCEMGAAAASSRLCPATLFMRSMHGVVDKAMPELCDSPLTSPSIRAVRPQGGDSDCAAMGSSSTAQNQVLLASPFGVGSWRRFQRTAILGEAGLAHSELLADSGTAQAGQPKQLVDPGLRHVDTGSTAMPPPSSSDANVLGAMLGCRRSSDDESVMSVGPRACSWGSMLGLGRGSSNPTQVPRGVAASPLGAVPFTEVDLELGLESPIPAPRPEDLIPCTATVQPPQQCGIQAAGSVHSSPQSTPGSASETRVLRNSDGRMDSFNSEDGFGSPYKRIFGTLRSVLRYEASGLEPGQALIAIVMEYCDRGSLAGAIKAGAFTRSPDNPLAYRSLLRTAQEVAAGMNYIHGVTALVHGDLKPGNVLLKASSADARGFTAKVSDFGLCADVHDPQANATLGTAPYVAPELWESTPATRASDVYAFGIMLWEMYHCRAPFEGMDAMLISYAVMFDAYRPPFQDDCPQPLRGLVCSCWHPDPARRPSFEQVWRELVQIEGSYRFDCHGRKASIDGSWGALGMSRVGSLSPRRRRRSHLSADDVAATAHLGAAQQPVP